MQFKAKGFGNYASPCSYTIATLSNGAIANDLEWPIPQISRSCHYLTLNISQMVKDTAIVAMEFYFIRFWYLRCCGCP